MNRRLPPALAALAVLAVSCADPVVEARGSFDSAQALVDRGRYDAALEELDAGLRKWDGDARAHYNRGVCLAVLGRQEEAIGAFARALELQPEYPAAWNNQGLSYGKLGRNDAAIAAFRTSIAQDGSAPGPYVNLATALYAAGRPEEALPVFEQALGIDPGLSSAHKNKGLALYALRRFEDAAPCFVRASELAPHDVELPYILGLAQLEAGRHAEALTTLEALVERLPRHPKLVEVRAAVERARGLLDRELETIVVSLEVLEAGEGRRLEYRVDGVAQAGLDGLARTLVRRAVKKGSAPVLIRPLVNEELRAAGEKAGVTYEEMVAVLDRVLAAGFKEAKLGEARDD